MTENNNDERSDNVPSPGPNSHSEDGSEAVGNLELIPHVLRDRLTFANPIAVAPMVWEVQFGPYSYRDNAHTHNGRTIQGLTINFAVKTVFENLMTLVYQISPPNIL
jgi:hypothetical protein